MRKRFEIQLELGTTPIEEIEIPARSRDELPPVMRALKYIYTTPAIHREVFQVLEQHIKIFKMGCLGMSLWEILVLGVVRLTLDIDYDRLEHIANYDLLVRQFLGVDSYAREPRKYPLQTLKDNVGLLTEELLVDINRIVVKTGHKITCKKKEDVLWVKVDTFPVQSNVHFPTDVSLLWDSARKSIKTILRLVEDTEIGSWRKGAYWIRHVKNAFIGVSKMMGKGGKNKKSRFKTKVREYLNVVKELSQKIDATLPEIKQSVSVNDIIRIAYLLELEYYKEMLDKHIDLVERRVLKEEKIPHSEKVFSIFEPYTEWIQKGKAGNKVELGLNVLAATDQHGFCLYHHVCEHEQDVSLAVPTVEKIMSDYHRKLGSVSFDRGFWSRENHDRLKEMISKVILPKKGRLNREEYDREHEKTFVALRHKHAAVESDINSLDHHGLERCPDKGLLHFKSYVALGVLAYNLHRLGNVLMTPERKKLKKRPAFAGAVSSAFA